MARLTRAVLLASTVASAATVGLGLGLLGGPEVVLAKAARPDPLAAEAGCERYVGIPIGANDTSQRFELILCPDPDPADPGRLRSTVQTSSLVSGWSKRRGSGRWDADGQTLRLVDEEFLDNRPEPDWMFCLIDALTLTRSESGGLQGSYVSYACDDRATLMLERLAADAVLDEAGSAPADSSGPASDPRPEPSAKDEPSERDEPARDPAPEPSRGCACAVSPGPSAPGLLGIVGLGLAGLGLRRRRRG